MKHSVIEWIDFVKRAQHAIATRKPGSPVLFLIPQEIDDQNIFVNFIQIDMEAFYFPAVIVQLVDAFARAAPDLKEAQELKSFCDELLGTIDVQDVTAGTN